MKKIIVYKAVNGWVVKIKIWSEESGATETFVYSKTNEALKEIKWQLNNWKSN